MPLLCRPTAPDRRTPGLRTEVFPLGVEFDDDETFTSLFDKVARATHDLLAQGRPGTASGRRNRNLRVTLNYLPMSLPPFAGLPTSVAWVHSGHGEAAHAVRLHVTDWLASGQPDLLLDLHHATFPDDPSRARAADHLGRVLRTMLSAPDTTIATVPLVGDQEREAIAALAVGPPAPPPTDVVAAFEEVAARVPDAVALHEGDRTWTYREVDEATRRVATAVHGRERVAVALERSAAAVLTILGTLRSGAAFVPVDPGWPSGRLDAVLVEVGVDLLVTATPAPERDGLPVRTVEDLLATPADPTATVRPAPDDLAYVLTTSGSTGRPKGVAIEHGSLAGYVSWARATYDAGRGLRWPLCTPLTFDLTMTSLFVPLTAGGSIVVHGRRDERVDTAVRRVLADDQVDIVKLTPSHLGLVQDMDLSGSAVRQLVLGGEDLTTAVARRTAQQFPAGTVLHNEYGPTEATVGCIVAQFDPDEHDAASVPIGRPIAGAEAWVLDAGTTPVPLGVTGDLWVGGPGVARGYVGRPDLTAAAFRHLPHLGPGRYYRTGDRARLHPDGTIAYLGRRDDQVKIRGARVELGEVEARLASHPRLRAVAAVAHTRTADTGPPEHHCVRCGIASDVPGIAFDADGVCSECRGFETYRDRAEVYFDSLDDLRTILRDARDRTRATHDCIALLSGGKDSTYALARLVDLGARPLAFTLDNGFISEDAKRNIRRVTDALGVDHVFGSTPAMDDIFVDSLQRHANVCNGCFKTIYTLSTTLAHERGIPVIVTGLSRGQFFETRLTRELFDDPDVTADRIDDEVLTARRAYHQVDDAPRRLLDTRVFDDDRVFDEVRYVDFYRYTDVSLDEMLAYLDQRLPWVRPSDTGRSTNCTINDVGIYVHRRQRGFHNYAVPYAWDVRLGHKQRDAALDELDDDIDPAHVQRVLDQIGYPSDLDTVTGDRRLVAYYVPEGDVTVAELRAHAADVLPAAMVPSQFIEVPAIPLTSHGKVDRAALPAPDAARPELASAFVAPLDDLQQTIAAVWSSVLDVTPVGIHDDFFELGGDSILAIRIVARCASRDVAFDLRALFDNPTVAALADHVRAAAAMPAPPTPPPTPPTPPTPPAAPAAPSAADLDRLAALLRDRGPST